ncbi:MAG: PAS domain S-box protein [Planctomycetes bacterium]|nr:PAS domain S-box protein [Planctomycetota bacterium]
MGPFLLINAAMIGFFGFASIYHLLLWSTSRRETLLGMFGLDCGVRALFTGVMLGLATASTIPEAQNALHARLALGILMMVTWVWSLSLISGVQARNYVWPVTVTFLTLFIVHVFLFPLNSVVVSVVPYQLPWGEVISNPRAGPPGWWFAPINLLAISIECFGLYCGTQLWRRDKVAATLIMCANVTFLTLHLSYILKAIGYIDVPFFGGLGHALWACTIGVVIARRIQETQQSGERFRLVFEGASDAILWVDAATGAITHCNLAAEKLLGRRRTEIVGQSQAILHSPEDVDGYRSLFRDDVATRPQSSVEVVMLRQDGQRIIASVTTSITKIAGRKVIQGIFRDITERTRADELLLASEQRFSMFMQSLPGLAWIKDHQGRYVYANDVAVNAFRTSRGALYGKTDLEVFPPATAHQFQQADQQALALGTGIQTIESLVHEDGTRHFCIVGKFPLPDPDGGASLVGGVAFDITERRQAEEALRESEARFRLISELASSFSYQATISTDHQVTFHWVNGKFEEVTGFCPEELSGAGWFALILPDDFLRLLGQVSALHVPDADLSEALEIRIRTRAGEVRWIRSVIHVVHPTSSDEQLTVFGAALDITEQKQGAEELQMMRFSVDHAGDSVFWVGRNGQILYANDAATSERGYSHDELLAMTVFDLDPDFPSEVWEAHFEELKRCGTLTLESRHRAKDGWIFPIEVNANYVRIGDKEFNFAFVRNITERKEREHRIRQLAAIVESTGDAIFATTMDGTITSWNRGAVQMFGFPADEMIGQSVSRLIPLHRADEMPRILGLVGEGQHIANFETAACGTNGVSIDVSLTISPVWDPDQTLIGASTIARDISARKQHEAEHRALQAQIQHSQKLESLGVLAGGLAHDFNNLLTVVLGNASLLLMQLPDDSPQSPMLREIEQAALSAADLTQQMLAYSGKGKFNIEPLRLDSLVQGMIVLLKSAVSKKAIVELSLQPVTIDGDATQIRQVVMNMIINASEALEGNVGWIRIRTAVQHVDPADLSSPFVPEKLAGGEYAIFEVEDNGCGMNEETLARIFDPFYSTKFTGRGLGLAAVLGIVRGHRGSIQVCSTPNDGTVFRVLFPRSTTIPREKSPEREVVVKHGRGTILVVDDELQIRVLIRQILEGAGFQVFAAVDGREGVAVFKEHHHEINAVLLDLTMPDMDGLEVLGELRRQSAEIPVLIMSGYNEQEVSNRCDGIRVNGFIHKPFNAGEMLSRIFEMLPSQPRQTNFHPGPAAPS